MLSYMYCCFRILKCFKAVSDSNSRHASMYRYGYKIDSDVSQPTETHLHVLTKEPTDSLGWERIIIVVHYIYREQYCTCRTERNNL